MEIPTNLIDSIPKCNATTDESILNTSDATASEAQSNDSPTEPKLSEPNESQKSDASPKLAGIIPTQPSKEFVTSDLKLWTFIHEGTTHTARHSPADVWVAYFSQYADLAEDADWTDMEERADFLVQLWEFCAAEKITFPLTEKLIVE